jgi:hypothetical protein
VVVQVELKLKKLVLQWMEVQEQVVVQMVLHNILERVIHLQLVHHKVIMEVLAKMHHLFLVVAVEEQAESEPQEVVDPILQKE